MNRNTFSVIKDIDFMRPGTGEFPAQMGSNAETVSIWWRHRETAIGEVQNWAFKASKLTNKFSLNMQVVKMSWTFPPVYF